MESTLSPLHTAATGQPSSFFFFQPLFILRGLYREHVLFCDPALLHTQMQSYLRSAQSAHSPLLLAPDQLHLEALMHHSGAIWRCFSLQNVRNKYFTNTRRPGLGGLAGYVCNVCCYLGSMPKSFGAKRKSESAVQTRCRGRAKKQVEYLLWLDICAG